MFEGMQPDPKSVAAINDEVARFRMLDAMLEWATWLADSLMLDETSNILAGACESIHSIIVTINKHQVTPCHDRAHRGYNGPDIACPDCRGREPHA